MKLIVRSIGKFGFLLAVMGFFMPVACDKNAFQLIEYVEAPAPVFIIGLFILALVGIIIGILLLMKKNVPIFVDWIIILACTGIGIGLLTMNNLDLQYGAYVIIAGFSVELLFLLIASFMSNTGSSNIINLSGSTKKCPFCANDIKREAVICQYCGKEVPIVNVPEKVTVKNKIDKKSLILLIPAIIGLLIIVYDLVKLSNHARIPTFYYIRIISGSIAIILIFVAWLKKISILTLISGIIYLGIFVNWIILTPSIQIRRIYSMIRMGNPIGISLDYLVLAIICFVVFFINKKKKI